MVPLPRACKAVAFYPRNSSFQEARECLLLAFCGIAKPTPVACLRTEIDLLTMTSIEASSEEPQRPQNRCSQSIRGQKANIAVSIKALIHAEFVFRHPSNEAT